MPSPAIPSRRHKHTWLYFFRIHDGSASCTKASTPACSYQRRWHTLSLKKLRGGCISYQNFRRCYTSTNNFRNKEICFTWWSDFSMCKECSPTWTYICLQKSMNFGMSRHVRQNMLPDWWPVICVSGKLRRRESTKPRGVTRADLNFFHDRTDLRYGDAFPQADHVTVPPRVWYW